VSDLVDPRTGLALAGAEGCLVLDGSAAEAEMASTGLLAMGRAWAARYAEREGRAVAWLGAGGAVDWLAGRA
jgi:thiamine biosynthesis lipoprotein ApbE